jgi:hypothetical protein
MSESCKTCRFFRIGRAVPNGIEREAGLCLRLPPQIVPSIVDRAIADVDGAKPAAYYAECWLEATRGLWPWTATGDWCGEYQPRASESLSEPT